MPILIVDTPLTKLAEVEHALLDLSRHVSLPDDLMLCTHMVSVGEPHYAFSASSASDPLFADICRYFPAWATTGSEGGGPAGVQVQSRHGGRAVKFPGWQNLVGTMETARAIERSALDRIDVLGSSPPPGDLRLVTRDFVRPLWTHGHLVLPTLPAGDGFIAPFEVPNPTECCVPRGNSSSCDEIRHVHA